MAEVLRLGIAGLGSAGTKVLPHVGRSAGVRLTAVADIRREALAPFRKKKIRTFDSVEEMCQSPQVDAVWIATPSDCHATHAMAAAEQGKQIICEKPLALSLQESSRVVEVVEKNGVRLLMHSKISDPPVALMQEVVSSGRLGRLIQVSTWNYKGWFQHPRLPDEVETSRGGGVLFRQGPHQVDIVRYIGGGMVKSVRAVAGRWSAHFDTEGDYTAFWEFEDGTPATLVFNGYGYFDMTELTWGLGEGGTRVSQRYRTKAKRPTGPVGPATRYALPLRGSARRRSGVLRQPFYGLTLVSCEKGDIRQSPDGLYLYTAKGREEIRCPRPLGRGRELQKLYEAVTAGRPVFPDARWGQASLEVLLAMLQSSQQRREVPLSHQVPSPL